MRSERLIIMQASEQTCEGTCHKDKESSLLKRPIVSISQLQTPIKEVITFLIANIYSQTKISFLRCFLTLVKTQLRKTETTVMMFPTLKGPSDITSFSLFQYPNTKRVGLVTPCKRIKPTSKSLLVRSLYRMVISYSQKTELRSEVASAADS